MDPLPGIFHYSIESLALVEELVRERLYYTMRTNGTEVCRSHVFHSFIHPSMQQTFTDYLVLELYQ